MISELRNQYNLWHYDYSDVEIIRLVKELKKRIMEDFNRNHPTYAHVWISETVKSARIGAPC